MAVSVIEKVLSGNTIYTDKYIRDTLRLTKSILLKNSNEAKYYNEYVALNYPQFPIDVRYRNTWRYYKHLTREYHEVDRPIEIVSKDNGLTIVLNKDNIETHRNTRRELLKFDLYYKEVVDRYPEQELLIKALIATSPSIHIDAVIELEDYSIVAYNASYIEDNEDDIILTLQHCIVNYKVNKLIPYYSLQDSLFLASQYHVLYYYITTTILGIRLKNAKTMKAHSYHVLNYFSSHHYLDIQYNYLTHKQIMFLYRNLLYLNNHSGRDDVFKLLIHKLFTERNITAVTYEYRQSNETTEDGLMKYRFRQKPLNDSNLLYSQSDFELEAIRAKEEPLAIGNIKEYLYHEPEIDFKLRNSLYSSELTKDLEIAIIDNTDNVRNKLIPTIVDYWGYLLLVNRMNYIATIVDPVNNSEHTLNTRDLFKLFTIALHVKNRIRLDIFPTYTVQRVYKPSLPSRNELLSYFLRNKYEDRATVDEILTAIPSYSYYVTSYQFEQFITKIYNLNLGLWLMNCNLHELNDNVQYENLIENLHQTLLLDLNDEPIDEFLTRVGFSNITTYSEETIDSIIFAVLNNVFDGKLEFIAKLKNTQRALIEVFQKFNSYTVQLVDKYLNADPVLAGLKFPCVTVSGDEVKLNQYVDIYNPYISMYYEIDLDTDVEYGVDVRHHHSTYDYNLIDFSTRNTVSIGTNNIQHITFRSFGMNEFNITVTPNITQSQEDLEFLMQNL